MIRSAALFALCLQLAAQPPKTLSLEEARRIAIEKHPAIQSSTLLAQAAAETVTQTRSARYPLLSGNFSNVGAERDTSVAAGNVTTSSLISRAGATGLTLSQLVTDFGRTSSLTRSAELRAGAQRERATFSRAQVLLDVSRAYFRALRAEAVLRVFRATVENRRVIVRQVRALAESNLRSTLDLSFAEVSLSEAELALYQADNQARAAHAGLSAAMGFASDQEFDLLEESLPAALDPDPAAVVREALDQRADLAQFRKNREAAEVFAKAERKLLFPTISALGVAGVIPAREQKLQGTYSGAGINISFPVLNGNLYSSRRKEAGFRAEAAQRDTEELAIQIAREAKVAWLEADSSFRKLDVAGRLVDQAARSLRLAQSRYDIGLSSIIELTQAQLNQTTAQIELANARYDYQSARTSLDFETGRLK